MIYLDYNATTPLAPEAREAMLPYLGRHFGNASSIHEAGREARAAIDDARDRLAALLGARPHEIIFTSGGTESDNLAILGLARALAGKGKHLIGTTVEHHAVLHTLEYLQKHEGYSVTWLPVDSFGLVDPGRLEASIRPDTTLASIMSANNETGVLQPIERIAAFCKERGVLLHSDMVQSFGKIPLPRGDFLPDAVSLAAHKFYGPKGAGLLYLRSGIPIRKIQFGGSHENERRPGTENVAAIAGMAVAAELALAETESEKQAALRDRLWDGIRAAFPDAILNGHPELRLANTLNVSFPGLDGEGMLINLDLEGVCASSGSACMAGSIQPSHVLLAMGAEPSPSCATVRFSLGRETTAEEIETVVGILPRLAASAS